MFPDEALIEAAAGNTLNVVHRDETLEQPVVDRLTAMARGRRELQRRDPQAGGAGGEASLTARPARRSPSAWRAHEIEGRLSGRPFLFASGGSTSKAHHPPRPFSDSARKTRRPAFRRPPLTLLTLPTLLAPPNPSRRFYDVAEPSNGKAMPRAAPSSHPPDLHEPHCLILGDTA